MKRFAVLISFALIFVIVAGAFGSSLAYTSPDSGKTRVLVEFAPGKKVAAENSLRAAGAEFHYSFDNLNTFAVTLPTAAMNALSNNPNVVAVEEDPLRFPIGIMASVPQAPALAGTQLVPYGVDMVQARDVWDANRDGNVDAGAPTGANRKICIIDSGFYTAHEDLQGVNVSGYNGNLPWNTGYSDHGTHVAGTIVAMNNALGVVGVTPGTVSVYSVRVFGDDGTWAYSSDLVDAANRCASAGANIISMSLGGSRASNTEKNAFASLFNSGILSIAAAGNDGNNRNSYPASYTSVISVAAIDSNKVVADFSQYTSQVELAAPGVAVLSTVPYLEANSLVTGGVTYAANHIDFSGRGSATGALVNGGLCDSTNSAWAGKVVLCERGTITFYEKVINVQNSGGAAAAVYNNVPGGFLGTLDPNSSTIIGISLSQEDGQYLVANKLGSSATVSSAFTRPANGYEYYDGTSMATPHVSAVAALVWSSKPTATNQEIRDALAATAEDLGAAGRDVYYGYGLVQAADAIAFLGGGTVDNPPSVSISSPSNGSSFTSGAPISFSGSATDDFDGNVSNSLVWTSDLQGQIGTGASFSAVLSDGTHTITATATDSSNNTGSASVTVTVGGGGTGGGDLVVSVSTDKSTYVNRDTAQITVTVTDGSSPVSGASVTVRITTPKGTVYSGTSSTNASGTVTFTFSVNTKKDGTGTYSVAATATASGYNPGSGSTTFQAQ